MFTVSTIAHSIPGKVMDSLSLSLSQRVCCTVDLTWKRRTFPGPRPRFLARVHARRFAARSCRRASRERNARNRFSFPWGRGGKSPSLHDFPVSSARACDTWLGKFSSLTCRATGGGGGAAAEGGGGGRGDGGDEVQDFRSPGSWERVTD